MGAKTKIGQRDSICNSVIGCLRGCDYRLKAVALTGMKGFMRESVRELMGAELRQEFSQVV